MSVVIPRFLVPAALLAGAAATAAFAATLETIVVTATRVSQTVENTLASVTVIDRKQIERSQARTIDELLAGVEGIALSRAGGVGQVTSVFMRGGESDHVLWLIDGVRIGSVTTGIPALQDLPLDTIERIEIVRGARSSLYGPDAMGGVIQIFTRRGPEATPSLRLTVGSHGTRQASASAGLANDRSWVDLQLTHLETDGTNACLGLPFPPGGGCFTAEPDRDPYRNRSANLRTGWRSPEGSLLEGFVQYAHADVAFDSSYLNQSDLANSVIGLRTSIPLWDGSSMLTVGRSADRSTSFRAGSSLEDLYNSQRDSLTWQYERGTAEQGWVLGLDGLRDRVQSDTGYTRRSRDNLGAFAQLATRLGRHRLELSGRYDDNEQFGDHATGQLSWGYRTSAGIQGFASVGRAFKAPTFNELYFPGFSNPNLDPERTLSLEVGARQRLSSGNWSASLYRSQVEDLIAFDLRTFLPQNIAQARLEGADGAFEWSVGPWRFEQTVGWLRARDRAVGRADRQLPRRPEWSGRTTLGWRDGAFELASSVQWASRRYDDLANTRELGGYAVLDLTASWRVAAGTELQWRVANALDRAYETATLYPALGREVFLTLRHRAP